MMDYFEDDIIEEQVSSAINFIEPKGNLKNALKDLKQAIEDNDKKKISSVCNKIDEFLKEYW